MLWSDFLEAFYGETLINRLSKAGQVISKTPVQLLLAFQCGNCSVAQSKVAEVDADKQVNDKQKQHMKGQFQQTIGLGLSWR